MVVDAKQVEHGGVKVAHVNGVLNDVVTEIIGLAVMHTALDSSAGKPAGEATGMVITPIIGACDIALAIHGASEFSDAHNQGIIEKSARLKILE